MIATPFAACGNDDSDVNATVPSGVANAREAEGEVLVSGHLFVLDDAIVVLAELAAELFSPQPGWATITVEGLDLDILDLKQAPEGSELANTERSAESITRGDLQER